MKISKVRRTYLLISLVGALPFFVVGFLWFLGVLEFIELKTLDWRMRLFSTRSQQGASEISLITLDADSEKALGPLPWPPYLYASLLSSLHTANPTALVLVMRFDREWGDQHLLPGQRLFAIRPYYAAVDVEQRRTIPAVNEWSALPRSLADAQEKSFSVFPFDISDGIRRSAQLVVRDLENGEHRYSLEILLLCQTYGIDPTSIRLRDGFWRGKYLELPLSTGRLVRIPIDSQGRLFIQFAGNLNSSRNSPPLWDTTSFIDALRQFEGDKEEFDRKFEDKCILIGVTTDAVVGAPTPFGKLSALALRANLLNALIKRDFVWSPGPGVEVLCFVVLGILSTLAASTIYRVGRGSRTMMLTAGGLLLLHLLLVLAGFVFFNLWGEVTASSLAIISTGIANSLLLGHLNLRHVVRQLQTTQDQLVQSEKEAVFGLMSAQVRHELRNALNLIRAPAEMIRNNFQRGDALGLGARTQEIVNEMDAIIVTVTTLDQMIEDELSFFQNTHLNLAIHDLEPILRIACEMNQVLISENGIRVSMNLPPRIPSVKLDFEKIRIVFANLIKNSCQAMPQGGELEVTVEHKRVFSQATIRRNSLKILVKDEGTGIPKDELECIFEPFFTTKPRGLGLGLVNVKNIVEVHGGSVHARSTVGVGTTFFIEFPIP